MKSLVFADSGVGESLVNWLLEHHREDLACIVTTSDNSIAAAAREGGVPNLVYKTEREFIAAWKVLGSEADYGFLLWWPNIVRADTLAIPRFGFVNTHPSFLPHNRGKHYNFWAIVEEAPFGVSLHYVEEGIDCGAIVAQQRIDYSWEDTGGTLYEKAQDAICNLFRSTYPNLRQGRFKGAPQDLSKGSFHWGKELEEASLIDLVKTYTAKELLNLLRARTFKGKPACRFREGDEEFEVRVTISKVNKTKSST
jgi:methionyl-tRNA formyltransferase